MPTGNDLRTCAGTEIGPCPLKVQVGRPRVRCITCAEVNTTIRNNRNQTKRRLARRAIRTVLPRPCQGANGEPCPTKARASAKGFRCRECAGKARKAGRAACYRIARAQGKYKKDAAEAPLIDKLMEKPRVRALVEAAWACGLQPIERVA